MGAYYTFSGCLLCEGDDIKVKGTSSIEGNPFVPSYGGGEKTMIGEFNTLIIEGTNLVDYGFVYADTYVDPFGFSYDTIIDTILYDDLADILICVRQGYGYFFCIYSINLPFPPSPPSPGVCVNDPEFEGGRFKQDCDKYLKNGKNRKCFGEIDGKLVADSCPAICKKELCTCKDREGKFTVKILNKSLKLSCTQIAESGLCDLDALSDTCPVSCGAKCL